MNNSELNILKNLFIELGELVGTYGGRNYKIQYNIIGNIIAAIDSDWPNDKKTEYIIRNYKNLYPANGGLSDFYIMHEDYKERLKLNEPLDRINDGLWNIIKNYF